MATEQDGAAAPAYQRIMQELREMIARGEYRHDVPFTTQREICDRFGVSMGTAVRALNELVREGVLVRQRGRGTFVAEAAVHPQPAPQPPPSGGATIALVLHGEGPQQSEILRGAGAVCDERGYRLFVSDSTPSAGHEDRALRQALAAGAGGVLLYARQGPGPLAALAELRRHRVPVVLLDRYLPGFPADTVHPDHYGTGYRLTEELVARGHRNIATLYGEYDCTSVQERSVGCLQALRDHDVPVRPDLMALRSYLDLDDAERRAFLAGLLRLPDPPTVLLCANGPVLATAAHDLVDLGLRIPEDVELAGAEEAGPFEPFPLARVAVVPPSREIGARAARLVIDRVGTDDPYRTPQHHVLPVDVRVHDSAHARLGPLGPAEDGAGPARAPVTG
ncbi:GntR family transcriptional regulator [Streptomyces sp. WMMC500]|uniref:GntR family transcriptional regulator n=1 Tax=Streptomyces sp. WMMC500 TaxID=3015154 RepID=UPI00248BCF24|nr:GntR family transcriptional regulator [Streptomyces sp. WMMC500]WBB61778.1 GntR family transcriptional regulator [Streptomyces sp. WMMC500]